MEDKIVVHMDSLFFHAYRITRNKQDSDDLVQDTIVRAIEQAHMYKEGNLLAWLKKMMFNIFVSQYRKNKRQNRLFYTKYQEQRSINNKTPLEEVIEKTEGEYDPRILYAIENMNPIYKGAFDLHLKKMSVKEMAQTLGIPVGTVLSRVGRAKEAVRAFAPLYR